MTDGQVIGEVLAGDTGRFEILVDRYLGMVRALCTAHVGMAAAQEDLTQETFIEGYVKLGQLRRPERFGPWLARIARNKCRSWLRKEGTKRRAYNAVAAEEIHPPKAEVLTALNRAELSGFVRQAIASLPDKTREAMMLCYIEGVSVKEAAEFLRISEAAVKKRLEYGRRLVSDGLWEVMTEHQAPPERRVMTKRIVAALPLAALPTKTGLAAILGGKMAAAAAALVLFAGAGTWYFTQDGASSSSGASSDEQVAMTGANGAGGGMGTLDPDGDGATTGVVASLEGNDAGASGNLGDDSESATLEVLVRYNPRISVPSDGSVRNDVPDARTDGPGLASGGRVAPDARMLAAPIQFNEIQFAFWCREAGISEDDIPKVTEFFKNRNMDGPVDLEALKPSLEKMEVFFEETYGQGSIWAELLFTPSPRREWLEGVTDDNGKWTVALRPGNYLLDVRAAKDEEPWSEEIMESAKSRVYVEAGEVSKPTLWITDPESLIRGRVLDAETYKPITDARVKIAGPILGEGNSHTFASIDKDGAFKFQPFTYGSGGEFRLEASSNSNAYLPAKVIEGVYDPNVPLPPFEILLSKRANIHGYVYQANGEPASGVNIMLGNLAGTGSSSIATTDEEGFYSGPHDGGVLELYASSTGNRSDEVKLELDPEESVEQNFTLPPSARVVLDIRTPEGEVPERIENGNLQREGHSHSGGILRREGDVYVLPYLQPNQYHLSFLVKGYATVQLNLDILPSDIEKRYRITLKEGKESLRVRVLNTEGTPAADAYVYLNSVLYSYDEQGRQTGYSSHMLISEKTDEKGEFTFTRLAPGEYGVSSGTAEEKVTLPMGEVVVLQKKEQQKAELHLGKYDIRAYDATRDDRPLMSERTELFILNAAGILSDGALEIGDNLLIFVKQGYTASIENLHVSQEIWDERTGPNRNVYGEHEVHLGEGGVLYGTAEEAPQKPWADKQILVYPAELWPQAQQNAGQYRWTSLGSTLAQGVRTDETGSFVLPYLPPGEYVVTTRTNPKQAAGPFEVRAGYETGPAILRKDK